jgi:hypothetical protein
VGGRIVNKYHARPVTDQGIRFDSQAEHRRWCELRLLEQAGAITDLRVHPRYELLPKTASERAVHYEGDFEYREGGLTVVEDVKGVATPTFRLKASMFRRRYPGIELRIINA